MNATISQRPISKVLTGLATMREVGCVGTVGELLDEARANPDFELVSTEVADHQSWFDRAAEYEREHGVDSLLNGQHPAHLEVMKIVNGVKDWNDVEAVAIAD